jgi:L-ascorbate metabolism protein UlaG (beta-lactamase superfamily)
VLTAWTARDDHAGKYREPRSIPSVASLGDNAVRFLGHATVVIDLDGVRFITDPLLRSWVPGLVHRHRVRDLSVVDGVQGILISHLHHDHLDLPSLRYLPPDAQVLAPFASAPLLGRMRSVLEMRETESAEVGGVRIVATHARHVGFRAPFGPLGGSLGFILEGSQRVYFAGDTDVFPGMSGFGPIDLALLPVAGWGPTLGPGHMDARAAVEALKLIRPRLAVPIHWGSLVPIGLHLRTWSYLKRPPHEFAEIAEREVSEVRVVVLEPGQGLEL